MNRPANVEGTEFDRYAGEYDAALAQGLSVSGEDKTHFANGRVAFLAKCLERLQERPRAVMDFGCGTGSATPFLLDVHGVESVVGVDVSVGSLELARKHHGGKRARFALFAEYEPDGNVDLAFCNGVFHHISPDGRPGALNYIHRSLRSGGMFALWENNPWNPGTRYVMSRIPFDRDAITLTAAEARRLLRAAGFEIVGTDFLFIFPRMLRWFRGVEPLVSRLPLGAQYQILCRKP
jgi:trans-aconitate methyltransferase